MVPTVVMVAALVTAYDPVGEVPFYTTPGCAVRFPCIVDKPATVERVQMYVSDNRGKTWTLYEEITPDQKAFFFQARKPGEYWFTLRTKKRDGTFDPAHPAKLVVMQRVAFETGTGTDSAALPKPTAEIANELDDELTRLELELIRKEIKRLAGEGQLTPDTEQKIDRLRARLSEARDRLRSREPLRAAPPTLSDPLVGSTEDRIPNSLRSVDPPPFKPLPPIIPTAPAQAPSEAPQPRVLERR
jgi:hypothetical protein